MLGVAGRWQKHRCPCLSDARVGRHCGSVRLHPLGRAERESVRRHRRVSATSGRSRAAALGLCEAPESLRLREDNLHQRFAAVLLSATTRETWLRSMGSVMTSIKGAGTIGETKRSSTEVAEPLGALVLVPLAGASYPNTDETSANFSGEILSGAKGCGPSTPVCSATRRVV